MGKGKVVAVGVSIIALVILFLNYMDEKEKNNELEKENEELKRKKNDYLNLLTELESKKDVPQKIKKQLEHLSDEYVVVNEHISGKLKVVRELLEDGKAEIAIEKLVAIIEDLLKERYVSEGKAKDKKSCPRLATLFEKAKEFKWITKHHFDFSHFIRDKRNEEAHELDAKFSENETSIALLTGLEIIYKLQGITAKPIPA
jgi:hypothetical protein